MLAADVGPQHLHNFSVIERLASSLSLIGICFILLTYGTSTAFHKPINRLVFFASLGNTFTNIATLISRDALTHDEGSLCKTQAFLIQMFMPADAYWTFAMACNVYLTFYHKFGAYQLRQLEKWYFIGCYGLPSIPAFVFLGVKTKDRGPMYGNATLWCWIGSRWDKLRLAVFYVPVWIVIVCTLVIYMRAGRDIWVKRKQLRNFDSSPPPPQPLTPSPRALFTGKGIQQTTQISVNYESASPTDSVSQLTQKNTPEIQYPSPSAKPENSFTVNISSVPQDEPNSSRWSYAEKNYDRKNSVAVCVAPVTARGHDGGPPRQYTANEANTAIWSYTKVSLLFFVAMMVTWIPSSANRVYSAVHKDQVSLPLEYASALVLPLQGFWNAIIYATTSLQACKELCSNIRSRKITKESRVRTPNPLTHYVEDDREHHGAERLSSAHASPRSGNKSFYVDTSSETELQIRPGTRDSRTT